MLKTRHYMAAVALGAAAFVPAIPASAQTMVHSGTITAFVNPNMGAGLGTIYIVGAIDDYGTTQNVTAAGTPSSNGNWARIVLTQGTFWVNLTSLNKLTNNIQPKFSATTCEAYIMASGPIGLSKGTGAYADIGGTLTVKEGFVFVSPRLKSGACNMSQSATPTHTEQVVIATGHVSYQ